MSEKPLPENLISGYLDNQLSPDERAEVETLLREYPEMKKLCESLERQSKEVANLPRYQLRDGFADELLDGDKIGFAFSQRSDSNVEKPANKEPYATSNGFGAAVAAIASLAASVLVTLFIQNQEGGPAVEVALVDGARKSDGQVDEIVDKKFANTKAGADAEFFQESSDKLKNEIATSSDEKMSKALPTFKSPGSAQFRSRNPKENKQRASIANDQRGLGDNPLGQTVQLGSDSAVDAFESQNADAAKKVVPAKPGVMSQRAANSNQTELALLQNQAISDVVEIEYPSSSNQFTDFHDALVRNSISVVVPGQVQDRLSESRDDSAGVVYDGGLVVDPNNEADVAGDQASSFEIGTNNGSQAFLVTATPDQIAALIADVQRTADVGSYRFLNYAVANNSDDYSFQPNSQLEDRSKQMGSNLVVPLPSNQIGPRTGIAQQLRRNEFSNERKQTVDLETGQQSKMTRGNSPKRISDEEKLAIVEKLKSYFNDDSRPVGSKQFLLIVRTQSSPDDSSMSRETDVAPNASSVTPKR